jgi:hypothetical protein
MKIIGMGMLNLDVRRRLVMIPVPSKINGKEVIYGEIEEAFTREGFVLGGNWDYYEGYFDNPLEQNEQETIYLRLPIQVVAGQLNDADARIKFGQPFLVRHVVEIGVDTEVDPLPLIDQIPGQATFLVNQFQTPDEKDGEIYNKQERIEEAKEAIERILPYLP